MEIVCVKRRGPIPFLTALFLFMFVVAFLSAGCHFLRPIPCVARDLHFCNEQLQSVVYNWALMK